MEASKYNYFINFNDRIVCLNGISGKTFSVNKEELSSMNEVLQEQNKQKENPSFTEWLLKNRFLVGNQSEELNYLRELNRKSIEDDYYTLVVNPTQECNFNCWYCYEKHESGYMNEDVINKVKSHIDLKLKEKYFKYLNLGWFGGEPLLYFNKVVYPLSIYAKEKCRSENVTFFNSITTNGFIINKKRIELFKEIDLRQFQITLDGDKSTHDNIRNQRGKPSFDRIIQNIIDICCLLPDSNITLRINYTDESIRTNFHDVLSIIPVEYRKQISIQFQRVWQTYSTKEQTEETKKFLKDNEDELRNNEFHVSYNHFYSIFKGHVCYADRKNYANVNYDGNVFRCTAKEYSPENSYGSLNENGEIIWQDEKLHNVDSKPYFDNKLCLECKYLPLCGGPCFQKALSAIENSENYCVKNILDTDVETFIIQHFLNVKEYNNIL